MTPLRRRMIEDMRVRNFAPGTQSTYVRHLARFAQHFGKSPEFLGLEELRAYQVYLVQEKQVSWSIFNTVVCALRFLYRITLSRDWLIQQIPFPRREKKLPVILSLSEVERFLQAIPNVKHRAILMTAYAAGLRVSEVASLHVTDIDSQRMVIRIQQGKGRKDRYVMLSSRLLTMLRPYWKVVRPTDCLFPGRRPDKPIVRSSVGVTTEGKTILLQGCLSSSRACRFVAGSVRRTMRAQCARSSIHAGTWKPIRSSCPGSQHRQRSRPSLWRTP
jgi:integrase/recombinase XerD